MKKIVCLIIALLMLCTSMSAMAEGMNYVDDPGFEGASNPGWTTGTMLKDSEIAFEGEGVLSINTVWSFYYVTGLRPDTEYVYTAYLKNSVAADQLFAGVKDYGGKETMRNIKDVDGWQKIEIPFKTGKTNTRASIYIGKNSGQGPSYIDEVSVREVEKLVINSVSAEKNDNKLNITVNICNNSEESISVVPICGVYNEHDAMIGWSMGTKTAIEGSYDYECEIELAGDYSYVVAYAWDEFYNMLPSAECKKSEAE